MARKIKETFNGSTPKGITVETAYNAVEEIVNKEPGRVFSFMLSQSINGRIKVSIIFTPEDGRICYCPLIHAGAIDVLVDAAGVYYEKGMKELKKRYNDGQIIALESLVSSMIQKSEHICRKACRLL